MIRKRPPPMTNEMLDLGMEWTQGSKHWKLMHNNNLVAIWPRGIATETGRGHLNIELQIRRYIKNRHAA